MTDHRIAVLGRLMGLIVHDLRNPMASLGANVAYLKDTGADACEPAPSDTLEVLSDMDVAVRDVIKGLDHLVWIGRWMAGQPSVSAADASVVPAIELVRKNLKDMDIAVTCAEPMMAARGGAGIGMLLRLFVENARLYGVGGRVSINARRDGGQIVVDVCDEGVAIPIDLRASAFTLEGQEALKDHAAGRYSRVLGLFAARLVADSIGAQLEATGVDGAAVFRIRLNAL